MKKMRNNMAEFKFLEEEESIPMGSKWILFQMIFDVKLDITRK
jgi:hypothetical protein